MYDIAPKAKKHPKPTHIVDQTRITLNQDDGFYVGEDYVVPDPVVVECDILHANHQRQAVLITPLYEVHSQEKERLGFCLLDTTPREYGASFAALYDNPDATGSLLFKALEMSLNENRLVLNGNRQFSAPAWINFFCTQREDLEINASFDKNTFSYNLALTNGANKIPIGTIKITMNYYLGVWQFDPQNGELDSATLLRVYSARDYENLKRGLLKREAAETLRLTMGKKRNLTPEDERRIRFLEEIMRKPFKPI